MNLRAHGFTLIELIITMIILGLAAMIIASTVTALSHSSDAVLREQAVSLAQAMMDEILAKKWDENSPNGGGPICSNESGTGRGNGSYTLSCPEAIRNATIPTALGPDGGENPTAADRSNWDDVDDYNNATEPSGGIFFDQTGAALPGNWAGFSRTVTVNYISSNSAVIDAATPGNAGSSTDSKRIIVNVQSPLGETITLVVATCNF